MWVPHNPSLRACLPCLKAGGANHTHISTQEAHSLLKTAAGGQGFLKCLNGGPASESHLQPPLTSCPHISRMCPVGKMGSQVQACFCYLTGTRAAPEGLGPHQEPFGLSTFRWRAQQYPDLPPSTSILPALQAQLEALLGQLGAPPEPEACLNLPILLA